MNLNKIKKFNIPKSPGVYQFFNKHGKTIYIGKASNLASRVLSYWQKSTNHTPAKYSMLKQINKIKWVKTDNEIEALLLESNLIKKHQPQYNVALRDDKRYIYIKISAEEDWPRIFITRKLERSGKYFGPFTSTGAVRETLKTIRKIWPYRSCSKIPKKACLYYRIGKCSGMCEEKISQEDYKKIIKQITAFLEGKKNRIIKNYELRIKKLEFGIRNFESGSIKYNEEEKKISELKYRLLNMKKVLEHANIINLIDKYATDVIELAKVLGLPKIPNRIEGYDISNIFGREAVGSMVVFIEGEPRKQEYRKFKIKVGQGDASDIRMLREVLERRFKNDWPLPDLIIIDGGKAQVNVAVRVLKKFNLNIPVLAISKGKKLRSARAPDKLFFPGEKKPLELPLASPALHLLKRVRDEAHRFAISYHRLLRKKRFLNV